MSGGNFEELMDRARKAGLLEVDIDQEWIEAYKREGVEIDRISKILPNLETHFSPGTSKEVVDLYSHIMQDVTTFHELHAAGKTDSPLYQCLEESLPIYLNIAEQIQSLGIKLRPERGVVPLTGRVGAERDVVTLCTGRDEPYRDEHGIER